MFHNAEDGETSPKGKKECVRGIARPFATIEAAIDDIRQGKMVVACDDESCENEGDLTVAVQVATPEAISARHSRSTVGFRNMKLSSEFWHFSAPVRVRR